MDDLRKRLALVTWNLSRQAAMEAGANLPVDQCEVTTEKYVDAVLAEIGKTHVLIPKAGHDPRIQWADTIDISGITGHSTSK